MPGAENFDITGGIKAIESLKYRLLADVTAIHGHLLNGSAGEHERAEKLADIVIGAYTLAQRLGVSCEELDEHLRNKLRLLVLEDKNTLANDEAKLLRHIENR